MSFQFLGPLQPLAPAILMSAYFITMLGLFELRSRLWGRPEDEDVNRRSASKLIGRYLRHYIMWTLRPYVWVLIKLGVTPNMITFASLLTSCGSGWAFAQGKFSTGGWLFLATGMLDIFDGRVARATNRVTASGAFFDSVMDRYAEFVVFAGMAYFYRDSWVFALVMGALLGSLMVSYSRARAEGLGVDDVNIGTMQRPERIVLLGVVSALTPIAETLWGHGGLPPFVPVVGALALLSLSANVTAVRRIRYTMNRIDSQARLPQVVVESAVEVRAEARPSVESASLAAPFVAARSGGARPEASRS